MFRSARGTSAWDGRSRSNRFVQPKARGRRCMATAFYEAFGLRLACTNGLWDPVEVVDRRKRSSRVDIWVRMTLLPHTADLCRKQGACRGVDNRDDKALVATAKLVQKRPKFLRSCINANCI